MPADKTDSKFKEYSYYITPVKIDGENYIVLSTIGHNEDGVYYYQNTFKGSPEKAFEEAKISTEKKFERLNKILSKAEKDGSWNPTWVEPQGFPATSTNKYSNFSEE